MKEKLHETLFNYCMHLLWTVFRSWCISVLSKSENKTTKIHRFIFFFFCKLTVCCHSSDLFIFFSMFHRMSRSHIFKSFDCMMERPWPFHPYIFIAYNTHTHTSCSMASKTMKTLNFQICSCRIFLVQFFLCAFVTKTRWKKTTKRK